MPGELFPTSITETHAAAISGRGGRGKGGVAGARFGWPTAETWNSGRYQCASSTASESVSAMASSLTFSHVLPR